MTDRKPYLNLCAVVLLAIFLLFAPFTLKVDAQTKPQSPVPLPVPFTPIVDNAGVIDDDTQQRLGALYLNLKDRANIEFAVLTVPTTGDTDIYDYSLAVARGWGIGSPESEKLGFLLIVAIQDRKYFTQVSRHLEGDLPDGLAGQIQREKLVPAFRQGRYSQGILDTIEAYTATLAEKRGFSIEGIDTRNAYRTEERRNPPSASLLCCAIVFIIFIILIFTSARRRGGSGCLQALFWGSLFSNFGGGGRRWDGGGSGWGGGGFGGGSGGGFGGFGGGFGGGGDFGGGGAGGSW